MWKPLTAKRSCEMTTTTTFLSQTIQATKLKNTSSTRSSSSRKKGKPPITMISSKTVKLFLLSLVVSLSMNTVIVSAHTIQHLPTTRIGSSSSGVRGSSSLRLLQNNDNLDSADDTDPSSSRDSNGTSSVDNNNNNSVDDDEDDQRRNSRFVAPRARQCTTGKLLMKEWAWIHNPFRL